LERLVAGWTKRARAGTTPRGDCGARCVFIPGLRMKPQGRCPRQNGHQFLPGATWRRRLCHTAPAKRTRLKFSPVYLIHNASCPPIGGHFLLPLCDTVGTCGIECARRESNFRNAIAKRCQPTRCCWRIHRGSRPRGRSSPRVAAGDDPCAGIAR